MLELHAYLYNLMWKQNKNKYLPPSSNERAGHVQLESKQEKLKEKQITTRVH